MTSSSEVGISIVYVITAEAGESRPRLGHVLQRNSGWSSYGYAGLAVAACTAISWFMFPYFSVANLSMVYLLGVASSPLDGDADHRFRHPLSAWRRSISSLSLPTFPLPSQTSNMY